MAALGVLLEHCRMMAARERDEARARQWAVMENEIREYLGEPMIEVPLPGL